MQKFTIEELNEKYDLELESVISQIKKQKARLVLLQFADGMKIYATSIVNYLEEKTNSEFLIWLESCYGACDTPTGLENITPKIDLVIQFGHNELQPNY